VRCVRLRGPIRCCHDPTTRRFKEGKGSDGRVTVLVLDEMDLLVTRTQQLLYNLFEWPTHGGSRLVILGIANTLDLPERLLPKIKSRLGANRVTFQPYTFAQVGLHSGRVTWRRRCLTWRRLIGPSGMCALMWTNQVLPRPYDALKKIVYARLNDAGIKIASGERESFESMAIEMAARKVAAVSGDARRVLELCRRGAENAEARVAARNTAEEADRKAAAAAGASSSSAGAGGFFGAGAAGGSTGGAGGAKARPLDSVTMKDITAAQTRMFETPFIRLLEASETVLPIKSNRSTCQVKPFCPSSQTVLPISQTVLPIKSNRSTFQMQLVPLLGGGVAARAHLPRRAHHGGAVVR
jgi:origin recognition complex subunit 1